MQKLPLLVIVGPTASGKTTLGIELAKRLNGEVVSADSMQIYKGIEIAAATPTKAETAGIPHHLISFLELGSSFSVADYVNLAKEKINEIYSRGKTPIVVGGTGLYVNSLVDGIQFSEIDTDINLRKSLEEKFDRVGAEEMLKELAAFDSETAERLHPNNRRRIIRAFEVYLQTGVTFSKQNALSKQNGSDYNATIIGIAFRDREKLYERINKRVDIMLQNGILEEAKNSLALKIGEGAAQAIGHKELREYLLGNESLDEAVERLKMQSRRYAKRQMTWFNKRNDINWVYADEEEVLPRALEIIKGGSKNG